MRDVVAEYQQRVRDAKAKKRLVPNRGLADHPISADDALDGLEVWLMAVGHAQDGSVIADYMHTIRAEVERLREKAKRFLGFRVRTELNVEGREWKPCSYPVHGLFTREQAESYASGARDMPNWHRNTVIVRVYRRAKNGGGG